MDKPIIGWREWAALPELGIERIKAKIDTGARTSALHAFNIQVYKKRGRDWVRFTIQPEQKNAINKQLCTCPVRETRTVTNSGGTREHRLVIETVMVMGDQSWPIEITLTNRDQMGFRMLLGRTAIKGRFLVNPGRSFCVKTLPAKDSPGSHASHPNTQEEE